MKPILCVCGILMSLHVTIVSGATPRPNILLIYTDDHSHRTVGCYPEAPDWVRTPNIDRLAAKGVRFAATYNGTWCIPARATLLTGRHPSGCQSLTMEGNYPSAKYDPHQLRFWPSVFREHGYTTAQIGKWHVGVDTGFRRDWDFQKVWNRPRYPENAGSYYEQQLIETNGGPPELTSGYSTDNYTQWGTDFIRSQQASPERPWFLWMCYGAVHAPFTPARRHLDAYPHVTVEVPTDTYPPRAGKPTYSAQMERWIKGEDGAARLSGGIQMETIEPERGLHGETLADWVRQYHQGVLALDEAVASFVQTLETTGQAENTLIIFTSDQGFAWGQHGFHSKLAPYDATIRSPLIISWPERFPQGKVCETPVSGVDLAPTLFDLIGQPVPWEMHGHSLLPLLNDPAARWPHPVLTMFTARRFGSETNQVPTDPAQLIQGRVPWWISLRQGRYKYIRTLVAGEPEELYDLQDDPEELNNLASEPSSRTQVLQYREEMLQELHRIGAPMVNSLPEVKQLPP